MIQSEKKIKELADILNKDNNVVIAAAIELLRQEKPFKGAIGLMADFYDKSDNFSVRKSISDFMNDLKDPSACEEVIVQIRKKWKPDTVSMLVSSCWQSGLNYSEYAVDLARVFLEGDYVTAIECLTVIEESSRDLSEKAKNEIIKMLEDSPVIQISEKQSLTLELISILER